MISIGQLKLDPLQSGNVKCSPVTGCQLTVGQRARGSSGNGIRDERSYRALWTDRRMLIRHLNRKNCFGKV